MRGKGVEETETAGRSGLPKDLMGKGEQKKRRCDQKEETRSEEMIRGTF